MSNKNKKSEKKTDFYLEESFDICNSSSTTDCTGLIFSAPQSDEEWDSYNEIYHFQPVSVKKESEK